MTTTQTTNVNELQQAVLDAFNAQPSLPKQVVHLQTFYETVLAARSSCGGIVGGLQGQELDSVVFAMGNAINEALPVSKRVRLDPHNPDPVDLIGKSQGVDIAKVRAQMVR